MLRPFRPEGRIERIEPTPRRYAFVFERRPVALTTALTYTEDPDRVLLGLHRRWDRGTAPATLVPLLRLLAVDPFAEVLVILPARRGDTTLYAGPAAALARRIRQHAPACWAALAPVYADEAAIKEIYAELEPADLVRDVLVHTPEP